MQLVHPGAVDGGAPPITLTLHDALEMARKYDTAYSSAMTEAKLAHEDRLQGRAAHLPSVGFTTQELLTAGNGTLPTGRFVTNDGVHVYRSWGVLHQDLSPSALMPGYSHAPAAEAMAKAKAEIALRGLTVTVTKNYYALIVARRGSTRTRSRHMSRPNTFLPSLSSAKMAARLLTAMSSSPSSKFLSKSKPTKKRS